MRGWTALRSPPAATGPAPPARFLGALVIAALASCSPIPAPDRPSKTAESEGPDDAPLEIGSRLPDFALSTPDGRLVTTEDLRGMVTVLTFVSSTGPAAEPSRAIVRRVTSVHRRLLPELQRRVRPVAVSLDGDAGLILVAEEVDDPEAWLLLSGPAPQIDRLGLPLGAVSWTEDGRTAHTLRTLVIDTELRLTDRFPGTAPWTPADLLAALARDARK